MERFGYSSLKREVVRFSMQIEQFSTYLSRGEFIGPEFEGKSSGTKWNLAICVTREDYHNNYVVEVILRRTDSGDNRLIKARVAIVDCFGSPAVTDEREIYFTGRYPDARLLSVNRENFSGVLNKRRFLPNNTLNLVCKLIVFEDDLKTFDKREEFENSSHQCDDVPNVSDSFAWNRVTCKKFDFVQRFSNFSLQSKKGRCVSPAHSSEFSSCKWSLVVCSTEDFLNVRLKRNDSFGRGQYVEVRLAIDGRFNLNWPCGKKKALYFAGSTDEELQIVAIDKKHVFGHNAYGLKELLLMPDDSLTLVCEIVEYEDDVVISASEEVRQQSNGFRSHTLWMSYLPALMTVLIYFIACGLIWCGFFSYIWDCIQYFIDFTVKFLLFAFIGAVVVLFLKAKAEDYIRAKAARQAKSNRHNSRNFHKSHSFQNHRYHSRQKMPYSQSNKKTWRSLYYAFKNNDNFCLLVTTSLIFIINRYGSIDPTFD